MQSLVSECNPTTKDDISFDNDTGPLKCSSNSHVESGVPQGNFEGAGSSPFDALVTGAKTPVETDRANGDLLEADAGHLHDFDFADLLEFEECGESPGVVSGLAAEELPDRENSKVPGMAASTLCVGGIWQSLCRHVFAVDSHFGYFFRALVCRTSRPVNRAPTASPFPMPLPYPEVFRRGSGHGQETDAPLRKIVNLQIAALNWLTLNRVREPPHWICGVSKLSELQWTVVTRLRKFCEAWYMHADVPASMMGRTAAKQESFEQALATLENHACDSLKRDHHYLGRKKKKNVANPTSKRGSVVGSMSKTNLGGAMSIIASRIKMSGRPSFDPTPFLNKETKDLYERPLQDVNDDLIGKLGPPRVTVHASFKEKLALLNLLEDTNRLAFRSMDSVHKGFGNGLFSVPKDLSVDRLILDARPANMLQFPPNRFIMSMGSSYALLGLHLKDSEKLLMSGDDLSNFFYMFQVNAERETKNFLEWAIPTTAVKHMRSFPSSLENETFVFACLSTLAMGDGAACEFAQTSHLALAVQSGVFNRHNIVTLHGAIPRGNFLGGIIIDDLILIEKVSIDADSALVSEQKRQMIHCMYNKVGLEAHPSKGFGNQSKANFWGADIDGESGFVRANITRALSLCWIAQQVAALRLASVNLLESLAGGFVSIFSYRRRMLSLMDSIYSVQAQRSQADIVHLPIALIDELTLMAILAPLAVTDIRTPFSADLYCVDASDWGEAVVKSHVGLAMGEELHRHALKRSVWTKMLSPFKRLMREKGILSADLELPPGEEAYTEHPMWQTAVKGLQYELVCKSRARRKRHINLGEVKSFLDAELCAGLESPQGVRVPIVADSQVSLGAITKGRSASPGINRLLRCSFPVFLGLGVYSCGAYARSADNPADDPTRGQRVRGPSIELPQWWNAASSGDFSEMDGFLRDAGLHPEQLDQVPCFSELNLKKMDLFSKTATSHHSAVRDRLRRRAMRKKATISESSGANHPDGRVTPWDKEVDDLLVSFPSELFLMSEGTIWPPASKGFLDVYSGKKGFARKAIQLGAAWVLTTDIEDGADCDLLKKSLQDKLHRMLVGGVFIHFSAAPVCASFSRAITPAVRSHQHPKGVPWASEVMKEKLKEGNIHLRFVCLMIGTCIVLGVHYWFENPDSSHMWYQKEVRDLPKNACDKFFRTDFCAYGTPWRKRTRFITSSRLAGTKRLCDRQHTHRVLRGRSKQHGLCWTKVAEPYPTKLCTLLAWTACCDLDILKMKGGVINNTAKCSGCRIGEAQHPGPRQKKDFNRGVGDLTNRPLVRDATAKLGERQWQLFCIWLSAKHCSSLLDSLWTCPSLLSLAMARYGEHLYESGESLYKMRQLVTYVQRVSPVLKGKLAAAWNLISRWEALEPVVHRRPVPLKLFEAMIAVSIGWNWKRFAGCVVLAYFGCCRMGEVLRSKRKHLVLAADLSLPPSSATFLRIMGPKPGRRGLGKIQHVKIDDVVGCRFLQSVFQNLDGDEPLYPGASSTFRKRWDTCLNAFKIPKAFSLTPGGLRAGGTIELYRRGIGIHDLLWRLRLRLIETLQHYLQEVSTDITMFDLPMNSRVLIAGASEMYPVFIQTSDS